MHISCVVDVKRVKKGGGKTTVGTFTYEEVVEAGSHKEYFASSGVDQQNVLPTSRRSRDGAVNYNENQLGK